MGRFRYSALSTAHIVQTAAVRFFLATAVSGAAGAEITRRLTEDVQRGRGAIVIGVTIGALLLPLVVLFIWAFFTAPRRNLQAQVVDLAEKVEGLQAQVGDLIEQKWGDPLQFLPIYQVLRTDLREAIRIIERAMETGKLWPRTRGPENRAWKKHRQAIASNPWARIDGIHGELQEAFDHIERLNTDTAVRVLGARRVREDDDLDSALAAFYEAEAMASGAIDRLELMTATEKPLGLAYDQRDLAV